MMRNRIASSVLVAAMLGVGVGTASRALGQSEIRPAEAQLVVTVTGKKSRPAPPLQQSDLVVKVRNRPADITGWTPLKGSNADLQLVFLFDESARSYLSLQIPTLTKFIESLPQSVAVGIAYMGNGRAIMTGPLTTDHALAAKSLRITNGIPGNQREPLLLPVESGEELAFQGKSSAARRLHGDQRRGSVLWFGGSAGSLCRRRNQRCAAGRVAGVFHVFCESRPWGIATTSGFLPGKATCCVSPMKPAVISTAWRFRLPSPSSRICSNSTNL